MKWILCAVLATTSPSISSAQALSLEDEGFSKPPPAIKATILRSSSYKGLKNMDIHCELQGKKIALETSESNKTYLVTTQNGCAWGAAAGPIWVVGAQGKQARVLAETTGYSLTLQSKAQHGMRNFEVSSSTAGSSTSQSWSYNGTTYIASEPVISTSEEAAQE